MTPDPSDEETPDAPRPTIRTVAPAKLLPFSPEAESHVLSCALIDAQTIDRCNEAGLSPQSFYQPANRALMGVMTGMVGRGLPIGLDTVAQELMDRKLLDQVGGMERLMELTSTVPTTAHISHFIERVRTDAGKREVLTRLAELDEHARNGMSLEEVYEEVGRIVKSGPVTKRSTPRPITSFQYPSSDDPNILLGKDDYLGRGGGMLFVSHAGAGKSSWIIDACMMWALGKPWMGLRCSIKLKSLIIQAEDSDRYIGKISASFAYKNKLTPTEITEIGQNCVIARVKGICGSAFITEMKRLIALHNPDLVIINPIYLYADGDISKGEVVQKFLLGLDQANKEEKFAYILIHHTGKPTQKDKAGKRAEVEDWESAYMGIGSSFWANWPRCSALLEPIAGAQGKFMIKLGKGGFNAGITKEVEQGAGTRSEPCTRIAIKHSTEKMDVNGHEKPVYYWELDDMPADVINPKGAGRKQKYEIETFFESFPTSYADALPAPRIYKLVDQYSSIPASSFKDLCQRSYEAKKIMRADRPGSGMVYWLKKDDPSVPIFVE